jgi:hypothetical protein
MDDIRDFVYIQPSASMDLKQIYVKYTECDRADQYDRVVMTREHFLKFAKHALGDKYSSRELEQVYRNIVSAKPLTFKRFSKVFR